MMKHKGYTGDVRVDLDAGVIRGRVIGLKDVITFQGKTVEEAATAFRESVDDYLAFCEERGEKPEKPFSGKILVRIDPEIHRALAMTAERSGKSLNSLVAGQLRMGFLNKGGVPSAEEFTAKAKRRPGIPLVSRKKHAKGVKPTKPLGDKESDTRAEEPGAESAK